MKKIFLLLIIFSLISVTAALAQGRPFETFDESRQRHSAENWTIYKQHNYQAPLGGYPERLGDPPPYGTERPGFITITPDRGKHSPFEPGPRRHSPW